MADETDRRLPLGLQARDVIHVLALAGGLAVNYGATAARISAVEHAVERVDARLWEMARGRTTASASLPMTCPADASRVALTSLPEMPYGPDR